MTTNNKRVDNIVAVVAGIMCTIAFVCGFVALITAHYIPAVVDFLAAFVLSLSYRTLRGLDA